METTQVAKTKHVLSDCPTLKTSKRVPFLPQRVFSRQGTPTQRDRPVPMATGRTGALADHHGNCERSEGYRFPLATDSAAHGSFWHTCGWIRVSRKQRGRGGRGGALTFLRDADGAAAHAHSQSVHARVDQVLCLSCRDHWNPKWKQFKIKGFTLNDASKRRKHPPFPPTTCRSAYFCLI